MSAYVKSPFKQSPALLVSGSPQYLFGSFDDRSSPTQGNVQSNSAVTTTATLTFQILSGNAPKVNDLITVVGCANSANFNVTNATLLTVSTTASGVCTVTYAITSTTQGTLTDGGQVIIPRVELSEAIANQASVPVAIPFNNAIPQSGRTVTATVSFPTLPTAAVVDLQGANFDIDSEYIKLGNVATVAGSAITAGPVAEFADDITAFRFFRFNVSGLTGSGTIIGKITA